MAELNIKEILQYNPELLHLAEEEQINVNHINCPAGADRKKRLYVRKRDGGLIFWCHHCQSAGGKAGQKRYIKDRSDVQTTWTLRLPYDFEPDPDKWPVTARHWLSQYEIRGEEIQRYGIGYSDNTSRVILPVRRGTELTAYQSRRIMEWDQGPKYLTDKHKSTRFPLFLGTNGVGTLTPPAPGRPDHRRTVVMTEDILSAIKVGRVLPAVSLLGVHLSDCNMYDLIAAGYRRFVVWLDDDNYEVRKQQRKIHKRLSNFGECILITNVGRDPKELITQEIRNVLEQSKAL